MSKLIFSSSEIAIKAKINQHFAHLFNMWDSLTELLDKKIAQWQINKDLYFENNNPLDLDSRMLVYWEDKVKNVNGFPISNVQISDYKNFCSKIKYPFDDDFWKTELKNGISNPKDAAIASQLLCRDWRLKFDEAYSNWELAELNQMEKELQDNLIEWLDSVEHFIKCLSKRSKVEDGFVSKVIEKLTSQNVESMTQWCEALVQMSTRLEKIGLDPTCWLEPSISALNSAGLSSLKLWTNVLTDDVGAQRIADLLGRMREAEWTNEKSVLHHDVKFSIPVIDTSSKEEIIGLKLGRDLEHALPSELALMADPDTEILFDLKYLESKLICFELQGTTFHDEIYQIEKESEFHKELAKGPMILCIDTSGSMKGEPEYMAKAMALYLGTKAKSEGRLCYVINFSRQIETFELSGSQGISSLVAFLRRSFHGGTDAAPALVHALELLEQENYNKADLLMISDFIMHSLPDTLLHAVEAQRQKGSRFNSLVVGDVFLTDRLTTLFDKEWVYNPYTKDIHEAVRFTNQLLAT